MYCPNCGTKNVEDAKFCDNCGHPLGAAEQPAQAPAQAPVQAPVQAPQQQVAYQQPPQQQYQQVQQPQQQPAAPAPGNGMAVASLVLGIIAALFMFIPGLSWIGIVCAIVGLVLGIMARKKAPSGMATAGMVLSIIALGISVIVTIACMACAGGIASLFSELAY